jgi:hypothetical protein
VVNTLHPKLIRRLLSTGSCSSHSPNVMQNVSTYCILIQSILHFLTLLNSSPNFRNISPLLKQFHSSHSLPISTHYSMTLCTDMPFCRHGFTVTQFCLVYHQIVLPNLINTQYWFFCVNVQKLFIFQTLRYRNQFHKLKSSSAEDVK